MVLIIIILTIISLWISFKIFPIKIDGNIKYSDERLLRGRIRRKELMKDKLEEGRIKEHLYKEVSKLKWK